jgi:hypothetical protein
VVQNVRFSVLYVILITSSEALRDHFGVSSNTLSYCPDLSSGAHLQDDYVERPPRRTKNHLAHANVVCSSMAGTLKASGWWIKLDGTPGVRTSTAVRSILAVIRAQQHRRILSGWKVEVET